MRDTPHAHNVGKVGGAGSSVRWEGGQWTVRVKVLPTITTAISQQSCEKNPSCSRGALEDRVKQGKICGDERNNSSVGGIANHHHHNKPAEL